MTSQGRGIDRSGENDATSEKTAVGDRIGSAREVSRYAR